MNGLLNVSTGHRPSKLWAPGWQMGPHKNKKTTKTTKKTCNDYKIVVKWPTTDQMQTQNDHKERHWPKNRHKMTTKN